MPAPKRSRRGLAQWITASAAPVFVVDARRVVLVFNHGCEQLTGWSAGEVIGRRCDYATEPDWQKVEAITGLMSPPAEAFELSVVSRAALLVDRQGGPHECRIFFFSLPEGEQDPRQRRVLGIVAPADRIGEPAAPPGEGRYRWHAELARMSHEVRSRYRLVAVVARTPQMMRVLSQLNLARTSLNSVHFVGEAGTGKEYLARCLHGATPQAASGPFVPLDCSQLGHFELKRTLTRAYDREHHPESPAGTLFLRRADELPRDLQENLVHSALAAPGHWRLMSSARAPLEEAVATERLSPDFACLLTTLTVTLPRLAERGEELFLTAQQILEELNRKQERQVEGFSQGVLDLFAEYQWPGNVRELAAVVREARERCQGHRIEAEDLPFRFRTGLDAQHISPPLTEPLKSLDDYLAEIEAARIREVLQATGGNKSEAAHLLGIPRPKLYRRLEQLGIEEREDGGKA